MNTWLRYVTCGVLGIALGAGAAIRQVGTGTLGTAATGPWRTGSDFGTARADNYTRAVVALHGLLALPAREARYYTAATDSAGDPLDGTCRYRVGGGAMPARWWSLTLYDTAGYLVANQAGRFSVSSAAIADPARWSIAVAPAEQAAPWLPTGRAARFELTLRTYLPAGDGHASLTAAQLPAIVREGC